MIVKIKIRNEVINISVPDVKSVKENRKRTLKLNKYKRILTKLFK